MTECASQPRRCYSDFVFVVKEMLICVNCLQFRECICDIEYGFIFRLHVIYVYSECMHLACYLAYAVVVRYSRYAVGIRGTIVRC